jgi:ATP-dependent DNA helicase RecQ
VVRQLLAQGLLAVDADGYGTLRLSPTSAEVLAGTRAVRLRRETARTRARAPRTARRADAAADLDTAATELFDRLRAWRAATAKDQGVPAYVVFHDATLREIATRRPASLDELGGVTGVGATKLERYGPGLLEALGA